MIFYVPPFTVIRILKFGNLEVLVSTKYDNLLRDFDRILEVCEPNGGYLYKGKKVYV